jgi:hypothetical protein
MKTDGTATIKKNFCLGRISHELVHVMPDQKTVVMGDDATNAGYFVFIADKAGDLSAGTLYVAKLTTPLTTLDPTAAAVPIQWIKLGTTTSATVEGWAKTTVRSPTPDDPPLPTSQWPPDPATLRIPSPLPRPQSPFPPPPHPHNRFLRTCSSAAPPTPSTRRTRRFGWGATRSGSRSSPGRS